MTHSKILCLLMVLILSATLGACQQSIKHQEEIKTQVVKPSGTQNTTITNSQPEEKLAVIYRSTDLGRTWSSYDHSIPEDATLSGIKQAGHKIYVTTDYHGIYWNTDGQNNWRRMNFDQLNQLDINCIEVENDKMVIGTLDHGIFVSDDAGISWSPTKINIENTPIRAFMKAHDTLYAGTDSGIFQSMDMGHTWSHAYGQIQILGFTSLNDKIYAATQHGALVCHGDPSIWQAIYEGDALHDIGNDGNYIYAMTIGQQLLKTQNDGASWENAQHGITRPPNYYTNELQHSGPDIFSAQWIGIYHSSNHGSDWKKLDGLPDSTAFSTLDITDYGIVAGISIR